MSRTRQMIQPLVDISLLRFGSLADPQKGQWNCGVLAIGPGGRVAEQFRQWVLVARLLTPHCGQVNVGVIGKEI